jgi:hypothetical protein
VLFWSDIWNDLLLGQKFPRLFSYVKNKNISVAMFILNNRIEDQFHLPLSVQAFQLQQILQNLQVSNSSRDSWEYIWGNSEYTASRLYHHTFKHFHPPNSLIWLWDSKCSNKIRVSTWLLMMDRLNVCNTMFRRDLVTHRSSYSCTGRKQAWPTSRSASRSDQYRQLVRSVFAGHHEESNELLPVMDPVEAGVPWIYSSIDKAS